MTPVIVLIPFLLGIISNDTVSDKMHYEFTFKVNVSAIRFLKSENATQPFSHMSVDLKCHNLPNAMMCRVGNYTDMSQPVMEESHLGSEHFNYLNKTEIINRHVFQNDSEPFQINFSSRGIDGYVVERNAIPTQMMNVYRMIANQLHVGTEITEEDSEFKQMEQSNIGVCYTRYVLKQMPLFLFQNVTLTTLSELNLEKSALLVMKLKNASECTLLSKFFFSATFWPEFIPGTTFSHSLMQSTHIFTISLHGIEFVNVNWYNLYDKFNKQFGDIVETVVLKLTSYRPLPPDHVITFDKKKTVLLDVINN